MPARRRWLVRFAGVCMRIAYRDRRSEVRGQRSGAGLSDLCLSPPHQIGLQLAEDGVAEGTPLGVSRLRAASLGAEQDGQVEQVVMAALLLLHVQVHPREAGRDGRRGL